MTFKDKYHLLHSDPVEDPESTDINSLLYSGEETLLLDLLGELTCDQKDLYNMQIRFHIVSPGVYCQAPSNKNDPASHDNVTEAMSLSKRFGWEFHKHLKIWNHYWHPRDVIYYGYLKGGWQKVLASCFMWLHSLMAIETCFSKFKYRPDTITIISDRISSGVWPTKADGSFKSFLALFWYRISKGEWPNQRKILKTDIEKLLWCKFHCIKMPITQRICEYALRRKWKTKNPYGFMFKEFFKYNDHPIRILSNKLYGEEL